MSDGSNQLSAELFYRNPLRVGEAKPAFGLEEPDPSRPDHAGHMAQIVDGRDTATSLEQEGFKLLQHSSSVADFYDDQCVQDQYYPEIKELVSRESGAAFVQVLSHITRSEEQALQGKRLGAHRLVHNDFTSNLIKDGFFAALEEEGKYDMENGRICIFNLGEGLMQMVSTLRWRFVMRHPLPKRS